jgi:hypothetical protein
MEYLDDDMANQELPSWMNLGRSEFLLRTEVAFWRDLVEGCGDAVPPESIERMQQALALAESRLLQLYATGRGTNRSNGGPVGASARGGAFIN